MTYCELSKVSNEFLLSGAYSSKDKKYVKLFLQILERLRFYVVDRRVYTPFSQNLIIKP